MTAYGVAEDLGLVEPPAQAAPAPKPAARQPSPSRAAVADIPAGYLRLYRTAGARYRIPWSVLAAIGKVESNHGRAQLPGVRSGSNWAGACGPMQIGCVPGSKAGNAWAHYGHGHPYDPATAIPAAARYLVDHGAPATTSTGPSSPTTPPGPMWPGSNSWPAATAVGVGGGERPNRPPPGKGPRLDSPGVRGRLRPLRHRAGPQHRPGSGRANRPSDPLSGLWHPDRPPAARHDQSGHRPRPGQGRREFAGLRRWPTARQPARSRRAEGGESPWPHPRPG